MIKPSNNNTSGYISYIDLLKFGQVTDFGYLQGYTSFSDWGGFIRSVHEHLQKWNVRNEQMKLYQFVCINRQIGTTLL